MSSESGPDTSRAVIKTYVPAYQKQIWTEHADRLDMSQSEFVRTMVQAGRRGFDFDDEGNSSTPTHQDKSGREGVELGQRIVDILETEGPSDWSDLVDRLTEDVEERLDDAIAQLQEANRIRYSGREDGYTVVEES